MSKNIKKSKLFNLPSTNDKVEKFINYIMRDGKKSTARKIFNDTMEEIKQNGHLNPQLILMTAIEKASPQIMIKSKRIGGAVYQIPIEVPVAKQYFYSSKWIIEAAKAKKGKPFYKKLSEELLASYSGQGAAYKKKEDVHKMAESNKAYTYLAKYVK